MPSVEGEASIDCDRRVHLCRAVCCRLRFPVSGQDVEAGTTMGDRLVPLLNRIKEDGYCYYLERTLRCGIWDRRPAPCRAFDCRDDGSIWKDFEKRSITRGLLKRRGAIGGRDR